MTRPILITGITGFLGSHLARFFLSKSYTVIGLKRKNSNLKLCKDFEHKVHFHDTDEANWEDEICKNNPSVIIHAAWEGVTALERNNIVQQLNNLTLLSFLLEISRKCMTDKFICIGSQAEYGFLDKPVAEDAELNPNSAYGIAKVVASKLVEKYATHYNLNWYWLRLFSVFGEDQSESWLIPSVINQLNSNTHKLSLTNCEQKYSYLYINDFLEIVYLLITKDDIPKSGIYNVSGDNALPVKDIIEKIGELIGKTNVILDFGALPQREGQSCHVEGYMNKFFTNVAPFVYTNLHDALERVIHYKHCV